MTRLVWHATDNCRECGVDITDRPPQAQFCLDCSNQRSKYTPPQKRRFYCFCCGAQRTYAERERGNRNYCDSCTEAIYEDDSRLARTSGRAEAARFIVRAKRGGLLPDLKEVEIECADCGGRATDYDHRDYQYPLLVTPVCRRCNLNRGVAKPKRFEYGSPI